MIIIYSFGTEYNMYMNNFTLIVIIMYALNCLHVFFSALAWVWKSLMTKKIMIIIMNPDVRPRHERFFFGKLTFIYTMQNKIILSISIKVKWNKNYDTYDDNNNNDI